ncbi:hypothetical protein I79_001199 [Cricetulus griseus]|uniref:Uncharacterized protein n=1 Tax=Cricetulus griseus TaxID=10029 RepID=G3GU50_CRIGR|nr:hypothetical protein I79_001199 [Cricetulus griseus]
METPLLGKIGNSIAQLKLETIFSWELLYGLQDKQAAHGLQGQPAQSQQQQAQPKMTTYSPDPALYAVMLHPLPAVMMNHGGRFNKGPGVSTVHPRRSR